MHCIKRLNTLRALIVTASMLSTISLNGCGLGQTVAYGTADIAASTFTTPVKTMNLDLSEAARPETCLTRSQTSTAVRIYQLKTAKSFEASDEPDFIDHDRDRLANDLLAAQNAVVHPGASVSLRTPMQAKARYVGIVAINGCADGNASKLLIPKKMWAKHDTVHVDLAGGSLHLED